MPTTTISTLRRSRVPSATAEVGCAAGRSSGRSRARAHARGVEMHEPVLLGWLSADLMTITVPAADGWGDAQVSWIVDGEGRRIIHCGDTLWHGYADA